MSRIDQTEVLVVGAGPVGLITALLLAEQGIQVKIIDKEYRTAARSYACALHPGTLQALDPGLVKEICVLGRPLDTLAFYEGPSRCAELRFAKLGGRLPFALILPQSALEDALEERLLARHRIKVLWNYRLQDLQFEKESVVASIDKLTQSAKGYAVADWDWIVEKRLQTRAAFVIGADGHDSMVRSRLAIDFEHLGDPQQFAVIEFKTDNNPGHEARVVIDDTTTNVLWPLSDDRCRWSFQILKATDLGEFPAKNRERVHLAEPEADERIKGAVERLTKHRVPWFKANVKDVQWATRIRFEPRLVKQFGNNRTWLLGDAAHQTGPVGVQSVNAGLIEATDIAHRLKKILRESASAGLLEEFSQIRRAQWLQLLGLTAVPPTTISENPWFKKRSARIIPCLPASGEDLAPLLSQLAVEFDTVGTAA